jgi:hypothetical protein
MERSEGLVARVGLGLPLRWLDWLHVDGRDGRSMGGAVLSSRWLSHDQSVSFSLVFRASMDRNKLAGDGRSTYVRVLATRTSMALRSHDQRTHVLLAFLFSTWKNYTRVLLCVD